MMLIHPTHDVEHKKFEISNVNFLVTFMLDGHMLDGQNSGFTFDGATIFELPLATTLSYLGLILNLL